MPKNKTIVYLNPNDVGKWSFPDDWIVQPTEAIIQGEYPQVQRPSKKKINWKELPKAIWKSILVFVEDYFTRKNDFKPK